MISESNTLRKNFIWEKSTSVPDLTEIHKWPPSVPQTVDQLKFYRRKNPLEDLHTKSNIYLYNKNDNILPFSSIKSEYQRRFKDPISPTRTSITRRPTSLKLEGSLNITTEHQTKFIPPSPEETLRCRASPLKLSENIIFKGDFNLDPEYKSAFIRHSPEAYIKETKPNDMTKYPENDQYRRSKSSFFENSESNKCHLKLEGDMICIPEYQSQYIPLTIERSHSIPQLSSIKFNGNLAGVSEYHDSYKCYDVYSKSTPNKMKDHIFFPEKFKILPEYTEEYKKPLVNKANKALSTKTENYFQLKGDFSKEVPEYNENFKDPKQKSLPERAKCREPCLRLKGKIEFNPEYGSSYIDYPRSRPITNKATSSLKLSNDTPKRSSSPKQKFYPSTPRIHNNLETDIPFPCQPEYRKAKKNFLLKERSLTRKITENSPSQKCTHEPSSVDIKNKLKTNAKRSSLIKSNSSEIDVNKMENIKNITEIYKKKTPPRFGRRATITSNAYMNRTKTSVIEANPKYIKNNVTILSPRKKRDRSFVVVTEPSKQSSWLKQSSKD